MLLNITAFIKTYKKLKIKYNFRYYIIKKIIKYFEKKIKKSYR